MERHPVATNAMVYGGLYTLAEISQQMLRTSLKSTSVSHADSVRPTTTSTAAAVPNRDLSRPSVASYVDVARPATAAAATTTAHLDMSSVKRYAIMGTVVFPPILTKWYSWLDNKFPCTSRAVVMKKLVLDQFLLTPWLLAIFFIGMAYLEGERGRSMLKELKIKFLKTFTFDCLYWLPVQAFNFLFVPPGLRVVYIGVTTFLWLNVLCYIKSTPN